MDCFPHFMTVEKYMKQTKLNCRNLWPKFCFIMVLLLRHAKLIFALLVFTLDLLHSSRNINFFNFLSSSFFRRRKMNIKKIRENMSHGSLEILKMQFYIWNEMRLVISLNYTHQPKKLKNCFRFLGNFITLFYMRVLQNG